MPHRVGDRNGGLTDDPNVTVRFNELVGKLGRAPLGWEGLCRVGIDRRRATSTPSGKLAR